MKIRIKDNSVRLRLSKSEVESFGETGYTEGQTNFGTAVLSYALSTTDKSEMYASLEDNKITMFLPTTTAKEWVQSQKVGFDVNMELGNDTPPLYLLLEKDFKCLDNTEEDQSDNYENPLASQFNK